MMQSRLIAAVNGGLAADVATVPVHWVYNQDELKDAVGDKDPLFLNPPITKFYSRKFGNHSPYGDELQPLIEALASNDLLSQPQLWERYYTWAKSHDGRLNHCSRHLVESVEKQSPSTLSEWEECVLEDSQANGYIKVPFIAAKFINDDKIFDKLRASVSACQKGPETQLASTLALHVFLNVVKEGKGVRGALEAALDREGQNAEEKELSDSVRKFLKSNETANQEEINNAAKEVGLSCELPGSIIVALSVAALNGTDYYKALQVNALIGGDNCSRSILIGALVAAASSNWSLPENFQKLGNFKQWGEMLV